MKIEIQPSKDVIEAWVRDYVPDKDIFFLTEKDYKNFEEYMHDALIIPKEEFFKHHSYMQIQLANSYEYWNISEEVQYVVVADSDWINSLSKKKKEQLFQIQKQVERGLIYPVFNLSSELSVLEDNIIDVDGERFLILQRAMWDELNYELKVSLMKEFAQEWEDWSCSAIPDKAPLHLKKFANTFPSASGSNCLSAVLFSVTQQEWMLHEWVHPETFIQNLEKANYSLTSSREIKAGDVVIWENSEGVIQHASYHIGDNLFFNKNGQTFFNPWKIVEFSELKKMWNKYSMESFRLGALG